MTCCTPKNTIILNPTYIVGYVSRDFNLPKRSLPNNNTLKSSILYSQHTVLERHKQQRQGVSHFFFLQAKQVVPRLAFKVQVGTLLGIYLQYYYYLPINDVGQDKVLGAAPYQVIALKLPTLSILESSLMKVCKQLVVLMK